MIHLKSFFRKASIKINFKHLVFSFFVILILFLSNEILDKNFELKINTINNRTIIISNDSLESSTITQDIKNNKNIINFKNITDKEFSIQIDNINNLEKINNYFTQKKYSIYYESLEYDKSMLNLINFFLVLFKFLIVIVILLVLKIFNDIIKEELDSNKLLFLLGFTITKIKILLFLKLTAIYLVSFVFALLLFLPLFIIIITKISFMKFTAFLNVLKFVSFLILFLLIISFSDIYIKRTIKNTDMLK